MASSILSSGCSTFADALAALGTDSSALRELETQSLTTRTSNPPFSTSNFGPLEAVARYLPFSVGTDSLLARPSQVKVDAQGLRKFVFRTLQALVDRQLGHPLHSALRLLTFLFREKATSKVISSIFLENPGSI